MRRAALLATAIMLVAAASNAEPINLKCLVQDPKEGKQYESWIVVDTAANYMRVNGAALELSITNEYYSSTTKPVGGFITVRRLNRSNGELLVSELYQSSVARVQKGTCERSEPPPTKF